MKRILSLDGGGLRGVFSIQVLAAIEALFRHVRKNDQLVLADEFDLFAGTSTGAIIATALAWGMPVKDIETLYLECGAEIFVKEHWYRRWKTKYRAEPIARKFGGILVDPEGSTQPALLGSKRLRTLLLIVMRNASTGSPWPVSNNPHARFNDTSLPDCNLNIPIWQLLRASTAAPSYFPPEEIELGDHKFLFVDGGMTPFNNPAMAAILMATLPAYGLSWATGRDKLHVVSIGTGGGTARLPQKKAHEINMLDALRYLAPALLGAVAAEQDMMCRVLGDCVHGAPLDAELQALDVPTLLTKDEQKFTYVRYDQKMEELRAAVPDLPVGEMDDVNMIPHLQKAGRGYAQRHVQWEHLFPRGADLDAAGSLRR
ncbi:MAG: patatin-like phospholipase family protein [Betaproteobacteria bacterium]